jgi:hypothetical protein
MTFVQTEPLKLNQSLAELDLDAIAKAGEGGNSSGNDAFATNDPGTPSSVGSNNTQRPRKATVRRNRHGTGQSPRNWIEVSRMSTLSKAQGSDKTSMVGVTEHPHQSEKMRKGEISAEPFPSSDKSQVLYKKVVHSKSDTARKLIRAVSLHLCNQLLYQYICSKY